MLKEVLETFSIRTDFDLKIMRPNQTLFNITNSILLEIEKVYEEVKPDLILVHGDTTTAFVSALAAFYKKIDVGHIEAGLRTHDIYSPYPEEFNRQAISLISKYHFAPTGLNKKNLLKIGVKPSKIFVTGNTAIDVLNYTIKDDFSDEILDWLGNNKLILMTSHRRELTSCKMEAIFTAILDLINDASDLRLLFPVHLNPKIQQLANKIFNGQEKVLLTPPLNIIRLQNLMKKSFLIITDSGGIQEEAPSLNVPVLVIRDKTERTEAIKAGTVILAGTDPSRIKRVLSKTINNKVLYKKIQKSKNPYGNGQASEKILNILNGIYTGGLDD
jgi:UDP-N-acetylglucosamine 2-epimerase (non-hydrolysing)